MDTDTLHALLKCPLFDGLTDGEQTALLHRVNYRVVRFRRGDVFSLAGDVCQYADIIVSGEMTPHLISPSGRSVRMPDLLPGKLLAPAFLFARENRYPVTIEVVADTWVFRLLPGDLEWLLHADQRLMMNFVRLLSNLVSNLTRRVGVLSMTVREKVWLYLSDLRREQQSDYIQLPLSRQQMADYFGVQKYSVQRILNELQQEGAIRLDGRHVEFCKR